MNLIENNLRENNISNNIEIGKKQELQLAIPCNGGVLITQ